MIHFFCPKCGELSAAGDSDRTSRCSHCGTSLRLQFESATAQSAFTSSAPSSTTGAGLFPLAVGHILVWLAFSLFIGLFQAFLLLAILSAVEAVFWLLLGQPDARTVVAALNQTWRWARATMSSDSELAVNIHNSASCEIAPSHRQVSPLDEIADHPEEPEEIIEGHPDLVGSERISPPTRFAGDKQYHLQPFAVAPARSEAVPEIRFYGPQAEVSIGRAKLQSPLIYCTAGTARGRFDASLVELGLPVASPGCPSPDELPYWPSYRDATPQQRSVYLDWLASGRRNPEVSIGFVFIYFYGLERRSLIDRTDHPEVARELVRLLSIYSKSGSFRHYASSLLWWTLATASTKGGPLDKALVIESVSATQRWDDDSVALCQSVYRQCGWLIDVDAAWQLVLHDDRTPSSVVARRNEALFRELFNKRFAAQFGAGIGLRAAKERRTLTYRPGNPSLMGESALEGARLAISVPDTAALRSQLLPVVDLWSECVEELRKFDRVQRNQGLSMSAEAYEALPPDLRTGDHPEYEDWLRIWRECQTEESSPLVPVSSLAKLKGISQRTALTRKQSEQIVSTADVLDFGLEPDVRLSGRNYRWEDVLALFALEPREAEDDDLAAYHAASVLLEVAVDVAAADEHVSAEELAQISYQLEHRFKLSANQAKRLQCRKNALLRDPAQCARLAATLQRTLDHEQRLLIGEFLVGVATADGVVSPKEVGALRKAFRSIGLESAELDGLLSRHRAVDKAPGGGPIASPSFILDMHSIAAKTAETAKVAELLARALSEEALSLSTELTGSLPPPNKDTSLPADVREPTALSDGLGIVAGLPLETLDRQYHNFLAELLARERWQRAELDAAARKNHLMLLGAIDAINEWSQENLGDLLIDGTESMIVNTSLVPC